MIPLKNPLPTGAHWGQPLTIDFLRLGALKIQVARDGNRLQAAFQSGRFLWVRVTKFR
jgi:hypothetical protein